MATIVTKSIGTSARDYSTIQAWEDAIPASLVATDEAWVGECYNDSEFTVVGTICTFAGVTTSATNYIELRPATGQGFKDHASAASNPLKYDQTKGVGLRTTGVYVDAIDIQIDNVRLRGLQISGADHGAAVNMETSTSSTGNLIRDCILVASQDYSYGGVVDIRAGTIENCLLVQTRASAGNGIFLSYPGTVNLYNCTVVRPSDITASHAAFGSAGSGTINVKNCAGFGFTNFSSGSGFAGSNNASDKTIGFGTSNQASLTYASQFEDVTDAAGYDFRAKAGGALLDLGTSTGTPTADIIGTSRPQGSAYDIGAWELAAAAAPGGSTVPTRKMRLFEGFKIKIISGKLKVLQN